MTMTQDALFPTAEQVQGLFKDLQGCINNIINEHPDGLIPALAVLSICPFTEETRSEVHVLLGADFDSKLDKKKVMKGLAAKIFRDRRMPIAVSFASEAWMVEELSGSDSYKNYLSLEDHPRKVEIIQLSALGFHKPYEPGLVMMDVREVSRDADNNLHWEGQWRDPKPVADARIEANILEMFFDGYLGFALRHENPDDYLASMHVEKMK